MFTRIAFYVALALALNAPATTYYVATNGADTNAGTSTNAPWLTIQHAANTLQPGDTALVRGGIYSEAVTMNVSGASNNFISFQNFPGEAPVVDGSNVPVPAGDSGLFTIVGRSNILISGFEVRNYRTNDLNITPAGIWISTGAHDITILSNNIHNIENTLSNADGAYGLVVWGDSALTCSNIIIRANELHDLKTGWSESMSLDGNVANFDVSSNQVHDNWNIGIDFTGYYGVCPVAALDRARDGFCHDNTVWDCSTASNTNYGSPSCAGIYCDGATDIIVERNLCYSNDIGFEFASENKGKATDYITVRDNICWSNGMGGIFIGGYKSSVGHTENCTITHNTLYHDDTLGWGQGEFLMQYDTLTNIFTHNILVEADTNLNLLLGNTYTQNTNNTLDWNLYFATGGASGAKWQWKKTTYTGFTAYQNATHNDSNSVLADPLFINATNLNFHLSTNSPAVNAGATNFVAGTNETDIDFQPRIAFGRTDIGADELNILSPALSIAPPGSTQCVVQLTGEPGHPYVWQESATLSGGWVSFLTNPAEPLYWNGPQVFTVTNPATLAMEFFRAQMTQ
jgi:hypothetical protein